MMSNCHNKWRHAILGCIMLLRSNEQTTLINLLRHPNINVNIQNTKDQTALMKAIDLGRLEIVKMLLTHPSIAINIQDNEI